MNILTLAKKYIDLTDLIQKNLTGMLINTETRSIAGKVVHNVAHRYSG
ncbi:MAG: hypothetical protein IPL53_15350 [Ignavibacteria bacterium]|nr:hypothetical protein [Ignavibacteria bacterium]